MLWKTCLVLVAGVVLGSSMTHLYQKLRTKWASEVSSIRILCLIPLSPQDHDKAKFIQETWGRRCDVLLFMSSQENSSIPTIALPVREGYGLLWGKMKASFQYVHEHHLQDVDWVLKADHDTYVVMENLRYLLSGYSPVDPVYFGHRFRTGGEEWVSGGAGYVMSREALRRLVEEAECQEGDEGTEDFLTSVCLESVGVRAADSRDAQDKARFLPINLRDVLSPTYGDDFWFPKTAKNPVGELFECCSDFLVSTHYVSKQDIYLLEFLIYQLKYYPTIRSCEDSTTTRQ